MGTKKARGFSGPTRKGRFDTPNRPNKFRAYGLNPQTLGLGGSPSVGFYRASVICGLESRRLVVLQKGPGKLPSGLYTNYVFGVTRVESRVSG